MKKLIVITALILFAGFSFGQTLKKGNLVGMHVLNVNLAPDVTMNEFLDFMKTKLLPEVEKFFPGWKGYLLQGIRGENENSIGLIYVIESENDRDKYFNEDGSSNVLGNSMMEKMQSIQQEGNKLGTWTSEYTDWLVQ